MSFRQPIWLDCDTGHDDAFAILVAAQHCGADLLGVSTTYGNADLANTTYNTRAILKSIGRDDIPVYPGAARPFCRSVEGSYAPDIHGKSGLDGTTTLKQPTVPAVTDITAIEAMNRAIRSTPPGTIWLIATGPLTNMALLFATYPDLVNHIQGLSIMGGALNVTATDQYGQTRIGNWTPWAEFNIYVDPESARAVFSNRELAGKTMLVPLDITHHFLATPKVMNDILISKLQDKRPAVRVLFYEILNYFAGRYKSHFGFTKGPPVHDVLAVAAVLCPKYFNYRTAEAVYDIQVVTDGAHGTSMAIRGSDSQCGRTIAFPRDISSGPGVKIPWGVDNDKMWSLINQVLTLAEASVAYTDGNQKIKKGTRRVRLDGASDE